MKKFLQNQYEFLLAIALVAVDLISKAFFDGKEFSVIQGIFSIKSVANTGAAFSFLTGKTVFLIAISIAFFAFFLAFHFSQKEKSNLYRFSFAIAFAGAVGNFIDRIFLGHVRDFLYFEIINFPIFNVADVCLNVGVVLFMIWVFKSEKALCKAKQKLPSTVSNSEPPVHEGEK